MIHLFSFTAMFLAILRGELRVSSLRRTDVQIHFGCGRGHLFGDDPSITDLVPYEIGWKNETKKKVRYGDAFDEGGEIGTKNVRVHIDMIDDSTREVWNEFRAAVLEAMEQNRIHWRCGNYSDLAKQKRAEGDVTVVLGQHESKELKRIFG